VPPGWFDPMRSLNLDNAGEIKPPSPAVCQEGRSTNRILGARSLPWLSSQTTRPTPTSEMWQVIISNSSLPSVSIIPRESIVQIVTACKSCGFSSRVLIVGYAMD
jgi:hypothetical protein